MFEYSIQELADGMRLGRWTSRRLIEEALRRVEAALQQAVDTASRSGVSPQELRQMLELLLEGN